MHRNRALVVTMSVVLVGAATMFYCSPPGDDGNGTDAATDPASEPETEASVDAAGEDTTAPDATGDDATAPDATSNDAATLDAIADDSSASDATLDAISDSGGDADAAPVDAGVWVVTSCALEAPSPNANTQIVVSDGKVYRTSWFGSPPKAGSSFVSYGSYLYTLSPSNQAALLAATKTVQTSDAGTTTTTGPAQHGTTRNGVLYSAGAQGNSPVLVHSLIDGLVNPPKQRVEVVHNDPAASVVRNLGGCFEAE